VLHELNSTTLKEMINVFHRVLKPGGMLYIRDHGLYYTPGNQIDLDKYLPKNGFTLEFKPHVIDREDLHGIPQIWRKTDERVVNSQKPEGTKIKSATNKIIKKYPKIEKRVKKVYNLKKKRNS
jgi:hypothetical protein